jgi:hypothetical protein
MKLLVFVGALALACVAAHAETQFRRDTADVSMMQDAIDNLQVDISRQSLIIGHVSNLGDNTASTADLDAVTSDVRFLVERSLAFADSNDLESLTNTLASAASRAEELRFSSAQLGASLPMLQSTTRRSLLLAENEHANYYQDALSTLASLEDRAATEIAMVNDAIDAYQSSEAETELDQLEGIASAITEYSEEFDNIFTEFYEFQNVNDATLSALQHLYANLRQYTELTHQRARWWYQVFSSYSQQHGWHASNQPEYYGGVHPSNWGNSNYYAGHMSADMNVLRTFFTRRGRGGPNANIWAREWKSYSSTNSRHVAVLFRIKNEAESDRNWQVYWYYSNYHGWGEQSGIAVNGNGIWTSPSGNCGLNCNSAVTIRIPARSIATVIFTTGSGPPSGDSRTVGMGFYNSCLTLPPGLSYEDDLSVATEVNTPLDEQ